MSSGPSASRKYRGYKTQDLVAQYFKSRGWPFATSAGAGRSGTDVLGVPGIGIEVKARSGFDPKAWIRQARGHGYDVSLVTFRPNGMGPATIEEWPVLLTLGELVTILRAAGYGYTEPDGDSPSTTAETQ